MQIFKRLISISFLLFIMVYKLVQISRNKDIQNQEYYIEAVTGQDLECDVSGKNLSSKIGIKIKINPSLYIGGERLISPEIAKDLVRVGNEPSTGFLRNNNSEVLEMNTNDFKSRVILKDLKCMTDYLEEILYEKISDKVLFFQYKQEVAESKLGGCQCYNLNCRWCDIDFQTHEEHRKKQNKCEKNRIVIDGKVNICARNIKDVKFVPFDYKRDKEGPIVRCKEKELNKLKEAKEKACESYEKINMKIISNEI